LAQISRTTSARTPEHRKILDAAYGRKDGELEAKVKAIYEELQISHVYKKYEEKTVKELRDKIGTARRVEKGSFSESDLKKHQVNNRPPQKKREGYIIMS
jgi:hypothetical protein